VNRVQLPTRRRHVDFARTCSNRCDIEIAAAGQLLGVRIDREIASFEAILPAPSSGKHEVGTGAGTTFETTLEREKHVCPDVGNPEYQVLSFSETAGIHLGLQQQHIDAITSTTNGLRHAASEQPNLQFLNEFNRLDVGFAFKKGSPPAPAFRGAVNKLIEDGVQQRILEKWGTQDSAIPESRISPPVLP
jgi:polar amino acid transport system substrate-binding protein